MNGAKLAISIDHDLCIGNATCEMAAPKAFELNAEGQSVVVDPEAEPLEALLDAVALCPVNAVIVVDVESGERLEP
jgi:ferredoxin